MEHAVAFLISGILIVFAYLIGIKKKLHLLSGYEENPTTDTDGLAKCAGVFFSVLGLSFIPLPFLKDWIGVSIVIGYLFLFFVCLFVMFKYTERFSKIEK